MVSKHVRSPLIIAHRGSSAVSPENTLAAFARALEDGADGIELDVRLTRDGVPVVIHDGSLRHVAGLDEVVEKLTYDQLREIDVSRRFYGAHGGRPQGSSDEQKIPALDDVFKLLRDRAPRPFLTYVEIKTTRSKTWNFELADAVVDLIKSHHFQNRTVVISFNLTTVATVKVLDPSIRSGALFSPRQKGLRSSHRIVQAAIDCGADELLLHRLIATRGVVDKARGRKLTPVVWTVDDVKWVTRAKRDAIEAIMTNNPALMIAERRRL